MRVITTKKVLQNSHSLRGIVLLMVLFILAFLSTGCEKESQKIVGVQQTLSSYSDTSHERPLEKKIIIVQLPGLPEGAKKLEMVLIKPGSFTMGSSMEEQGRSGTDWPLHEVTITKPFYMGKYEVTQAQWESVQSVDFHYSLGFRLVRE